jgi:XrtN system VIT domain protein
MSTLKFLFKDSIYTTGLACLLISGFVYAYPLMFAYPREENLLLFFFNYALTIVYFFVLIANRKSIDPAKKLNYRFLLLILFLISAYSLNRDMNVFEKSVNWLSVALSVSCANYILYTYFDKIPDWTRHIQAFISGFSFVLFSYLAIYLLPLYAIGVVGFLALGISLHVFVPALFAVNTVYMIRRSILKQKKILWSFAAGITAPVLFVSVFIIKWDRVKEEINLVHLSKKNNGELPSWVYIAQKTPNNMMAEKVLKAGIVYSIPEQSTEIFFWRIPDMSFNEKKKHDPLVMCSVFLSGTPEIEETDRIQILKSNFSARHQAEERIWRGDDLFTEQVNTVVRIWPVCNIGYTEKTITVTNRAPERAWPRQQEGIYTFHLPEGGVVSSLSLWVNGKEEKAILTIKEKADSAYKTVVGVERRDPSVVHWQEGNRVSLRVFPVFSGESRMFKLGITAPLARANGKLIYENIDFDGPDKNKTKESIKVDFEQSPDEFQLPATFVSKSSQSYNRKGNYEPYWNLSLSDKGLTSCSFSFDGSAYSLKPYHKKLSPAIVEDIYLDVNKSWTKTEFEKAFEIAGNRNVFVYDNEIIKVSYENEKELFSRLKAIEFSLFPIYKIKNPAASMVVTKGAAASCNLDDLAQTPFIEETKKFLSRDQKIKLFNISQNLSPYIKSLKEYRVFQYDSGDMEVLRHLLSDKVFADDMEDDNRVIIHKADMVIEKSGELLPSSGPDHIMRLFAYNHIMQKLGTGLMINRPIEDSLVEEAKKAYVLSPLSSLIVLETEQDYKRFDIKDTGNSLKNASLTSKGAVPEPHEWVLITIGVLLIVYLKFRSGLKWAKT